MRVLVIGYVWPEPTSSAAGGHMMQILEAFVGQGWEVTFSSPAAAGEHTADLAALGIQRCAITLNDSSFDRFIEGLQPDIVLFDRFMMEEQFGWRVERHCPTALRVLETSDFASLRDARQRLLKQHLKDAPEPDDCTALFAPQGQALYAHMAEADMTLREIAAIYRCDLSLMISDVEIDLLTQVFGVPANLLLWCPLMLQAPDSPLPGFAERQHFLSIGNFRHAPNWDAVQWMKTAVWPLIRARLPQAQLHIYGAYTPPKATALHSPKQGFLVLDRAEDALVVMRQARVALAPLRFGAGIKGKLADAMLCGTPSVTTVMGSEGMQGALPWPGAVANDAQGLAAAAVALYQDPQRWLLAQAQGVRLLAERYAAKPHQEALIARLQALRGQLGAHRLGNFTGTLLRHHHHKSTQYMAQWIEAKNRLD
ncbi:MAG: glycosyltransferase [Janthinobacterium lividum]|uniref:glycosyltransferase n=1 Tax=Pseudomonas sp. MWU16-30317 TaxID=2878095 RepID=UPI001CFA7911|nr:glycosyltransferase family 4 protein [Pseudomonas sp. MWU16-30317]